MMLLTEQQQIDVLRDKCENVTKRIWIASPYIGSLKDVQKVIGGKWMLPSVDCRVLTDVEAGFIRQDTFDEFINNQVEVKSLNSLHAKVYIIDDWCLVTSANLTGTGFLCRYEMGFATENFKEVESAYLRWWDQADSVTKLLKKPSKALADYQDGTRFTKKFKAQPYYSGKQDKYDAKCEKYRDFARLYEKLTGRNQQMVADGYTLLQETDYLFNFLYHDHPKTPSNGLKMQNVISEYQRDKLLLSYFRDMSKYYAEDPQYWRLDRTQRIQKLLSPSSIKILSWNDVKEVVNCLHCLWSYPINKTKFLNPDNNKLDEIRKCWQQLLHSGPITFSKVKYVYDRLYYFGLSSIYELIGWYYPDKYPLMNGNSDCGMRFFGYNV